MTDTPTVPVINPDDLKFMALAFQASTEAVYVTKFQLFNIEGPGPERFSIVFGNSIKAPIGLNGDSVIAVSAVASVHFDTALAQLLVNTLAKNHNIRPQV